MVSRRPLCDFKKGISYGPLARASSSTLALCKLLLPPSSLRDSEEGEPSRGHS